jgi:uncharacterized protein YigE (DUF2233 family)
VRRPVKALLAVGLVGATLAYGIVFLRSRTSGFSVSDDFDPALLNAGCTVRSVGSARFRVCEYGLDTIELRLYWKDEKGEQIGDLHRLREIITAEGRELVAAMNAGMYGGDADSTPVGIYIERGRELVPLNLRDSAGGNFYDEPNGVFYVANGRAAVVERGEFARLGVRPDLATQSGPLLVQRGAFPHAGYKPNGPRLAPRNAVGVRADGTVVLVLAESETNMHELRVALRDHFGCTDALYLDGAISELMVPVDSPSMRRHGAIIGILRPPAER